VKIFKRAENQVKKPVARRPTAPRRFNLAPGRTYVIEEAPPDFSYELFMDLTSTAEKDGGHPKGLLVSRRHRDMVRQRHGLEGVRIYWLATRPGEGVIAPTNLGILTSTLVKFLEENKYGVVLLDGVEYLVSNNDFVRVLRMIEQVNDQVAQGSGRMVLPVDVRAFDPKELALLERNMEKAHRPAPKA